VPKPPADEVTAMEHANMARRLVALQAQKEAALVCPRLLSIALPVVSVIGSQTPNSAWKAVDNPVAH
jgi:hypothetical protein